MAKKGIGKFVALAAVAGAAAAGISYLTKYRSFNKELDKEFHDFEDADDEQPVPDSTMNRNYVSLSANKDELLVAAGGMLNAAKDVAGAAKNVIKDAAAIAADTTKEAVKVANEKKNSLVNSAKNLKDNADEVLDEAGDAVEEAVETVQDAVEDAAETVEDMAEEAAEKGETAVVVDDPEDQMP